MPFGDNTQLYAGGKLSVQEAIGDFTHVFTFGPDDVKSIGAASVGLLEPPAKGYVKDVVVYSDANWGPDISIGVGAQGDSDGLIASISSESDNSNGMISSNTGALSAGSTTGALVSNGSITATFSGTTASISSGVDGATGSIVVGLRVLDPTRFA